MYPACWKCFAPNRQCRRECRTAGRETGGDFFPSTQCTIKTFVLCLETERRGSEDVPVLDREVGSCTTRGCGNSCPSSTRQPVATEGEESHRVSHNEQEPSLVLRENIVRWIMKHRGNETAQSQTPHTKHTLIKWYVCSVYGWYIKTFQLEQFVY